jgi:hypothetical protein
MVEPEEGGINVVSVGKFNPAIFQPAWFLSNGLIGAEQAKGAVRAKELEDISLEGVHPEATAFRAGWLEVQVTRDRCVLGTSELSSRQALFDFVINTFTLLSHTPVGAFGVNVGAHFRLHDEAKWNSLGDRLAPKDLWQGILDRPGLRTLTMEEPREEKDNIPAGWFRIEVGPSIRVPVGLFTATNEHFDLSDKDEFRSGGELVRLLEVVGPRSAQHAFEVIDSLLALT